MPSNHFFWHVGDWQESWMRSNHNVILKQSRIPAVNHF